RISRSCRRSSFSLRRRVSSLPTSSCGPSSKSLCSCSERHRLNVDLAMPRSFATRSTLRPLVSVSRTASRLNSFVNRLCLFLLIATSAIFHRGWLSTFAGQVQWHCHGGSGLRSPWRFRRHPRGFDLRPSRQSDEPESCQQKGRSVSVLCVLDPPADHIGARCRGSCCKALKEALRTDPKTTQTTMTSGTWNSSASMSKGLWSMQIRYGGMDRAPDN